MGMSPIVSLNYVFQPRKVLMFPGLWQSSLSESVFKATVGKEYNWCKLGKHQVPQCLEEALGKKSRKILKENKHFYHLCGEFVTCWVYLYVTLITKSNHCFVMPCCETCPQASDSLEDDVKASVYQWLYCSTVSFWAFCASGSKTRHHFLAKRMFMFS